MRVWDRFHLFDRFVKRFSATIMLGFLLLLGHSPLSSQTTSGSIVGTVTDPSGAPVPGVSVTVTNEGTGINVFTTITNENGGYVATPLQVGRYTVTVEMPGFKKLAKSGINVSVQDRIGLNFVLEIGEITETVEVLGGAPALQTDTSYLGQVVESKRIEDLPLNGRFFTQLAVLTAGATPTAPGARDERTGGFSANGVRPFQNNYLLDGIDNNSLSQDLTNEASFVYAPSPDAIQEFKVQTNSMSAEFGRSGGAVMNVTVKSGTNGLHGTLFHFLRNDKLDAKNFFADEKPPFKQNQFGAAVGGPVIKNRTFFFADYQGTRQRIGHTFLTQVPPNEWRQGDFTGFNTILDPDSSTDPAGRTPFPNNRIPAERFDPVALKLIAWMPEPNLPGSRSSSGVANNFRRIATEPSRTDQGDIRIDHRISDEDSIFGRFSMSNQELAPPSAIPKPLSGAQFSSGDWTNNSRNVALGWTHTVSPNVINEFRAGYTRLRSERLQFNSDENLSAQIGLPGVPFGPTNGSLPIFTISGVRSFGGSGFQPTREFQNVWHIVNTLSVIHGRHTIRFGAEWKPKVDFSILQPPRPRGQFSFGGEFTRDPKNRARTGLGFADFLLGKVGFARLASFIDNTFEQPGYFFFVQDDIKVTSKLTLNLGLRYDFVTHATERHDAVGSFNLVTGALDLVEGRSDPLPANFFPEVAVNRNAPRQLVEQDRNNFGPRVGFAYHLTPKTVLRSGYGIFYSSYEAGPLSIPNPGNVPPFFLDSRWNPIAFGVPNPAVNQLSGGFPADAFAEPAAAALFALDPTFRSPYVQHWNFGVQRDLTWNTVWEISYAGSAGKKLYQFRDANQPAATPDASIPTNSRRPLPFLGGSLTWWCACNSSTYHSLQTKVEKRFSSGLSFLGAYTWGRSIDESSQASLGFDNSTGTRDQRNWSAEKARSDFDISHRFVVSYSYEVPFGRHLAGIAKAVLSGWQLQGIHAFNSGTPFTVTARDNFSNAGGGSRPDRILTVPTTPANGRTREQWFNPAGFQNPAPGNWGNSGRNILSSPGTVSVDFAVFKDFPLTADEDKKMQFRAEFFNLPNHPNFRDLNTTFDSSNPGELQSVTQMRQIQFALKLIF